MTNRNGIIYILIFVFFMSNYQSFCQKSRLTPNDIIALKKAAIEFKTPHKIYSKRKIKVKDSSEVQNNGTKTYTVGKYNLREPDSEMFLRIIGYISSREGKLIEVYKRTTIHKPNGNKYYFLEYILEGNIAGSVIFQYAGIDMEKPVGKDNPSIKKCVIDDKFCTDCRWEREEDSNGNPLWACDCFKSNDKENSGDCALTYEFIPDFGSYYNIGKSIIDSVKISQLQIEKYKTY